MSSLYLNAADKHTHDIITGNKMEKGGNRQKNQMNKLLNIIPVIRTQLIQIL